MIDDTKSEPENTTSTETSQTSTGEGGVKPQDAAQEKEDTGPQVKAEHPQVDNNDPDQSTKRTDGPVIKNESKVRKQYVATSQFNAEKQEFTISTDLSELFKKSFRDPTKELPSQLDAPAFPLHDYPHLIEALEEYRLIVLSSFDRQISFWAAHALARHQRFDQYDRRLLVVTKTDEERYDLSLDIFSRQDYYDQHEKVILIEIIHAGCFLESLRTESYGAPGSLKKSLHDKRIVVVCATSCELLGAAPDGSLSISLPFYHCGIPYLYHKLTQYYSRERAREVERDLLRQREQKLWADFSTTEYFLREVTNLLGTPTQLEAEIERRESLFRDRPTVESIEMLKSVRPADLLNDEDVLRSAVLYTATYFRDLTPSDFEEITCLILGDATTEIEAESQVVNRRGDVQVRRQKITKRWVDLWNESPDRILRECSLEAVSRNGLLQVIDFSKGYLRQDLRVYLESKYPVRLARSFKILQDSGLLFRQDTSEAIVDNLVRLLVERTISDPSYCNRDWLIQIIVMLRIHFEEREDQEDPSEDFLTLLARLRESEILRRHFYSRLCQLIREMLQHETLRGTIKGFLNFLVAHEHGAALDIVLELARRLRFSPEFEAFYWIRRLLDQGRLEVQKRTYQCLFTFANESGIRFYDVLEAIRGWLPEPTFDIELYSQSNSYALAFLPDYCFATAHNFPARHYGEWPSRYTLFAALPSDPTKARARLDLIADWLTHPGLKTTLHIEESASEDLIASFIADLIELWILILEGIEPKGINPQAQSLATTLLDTFAARIGPHQEICLLRRWQWRQQAYYKQVNLLPVHKREERSTLLTRRKKLLETKERFIQCGPQRL